MATRTLNCCFLLLHVLLACVIASSGSQEDDAKNLLKFRDSLLNTTQLNNWNATVPMCKNRTANWNGLICLNNVLFGLQLEAMGLGGIVDVDTLAALRTLRTINFMNNSFDGPMPSIKNLGALRGFYITGNQFSGEIPDDAFSRMKLLKKVYLANNRFTGKIPKSLSELPKLGDLQLENNQFDGEIPDFQQQNLTVNLAYNKLEGRIPEGLSNQNPSAFLASHITLLTSNLCLMNQETTFAASLLALVRQRSMPSSNGLYLIATVGPYGCTGVSETRKELHLPREKSTEILVDKLALPLAKNLVFHDRSKHIQYKEDDAKNLLKFRDSLLNTKQLNNWNATVPMCKNRTANWNGLICLNNALFGLQLETMGLGGIIDVDTLAALPTLKTISFMNNSFDGPMPSIKNLGALRGFYISGNQFSGEIPDDAFSGMKLLKKVYLANNRFTGKIPKSLAELPKLGDLQLENNQFDGEIPDFQQQNLTVNLANNKLEGRIPDGLRNQKSSAFLGNNLCGKPLSPCASKKHFLPKFAMIVIAAGLAAIAVIIIGLMVIHSRARHQASKSGPAGKVQKKKVGYQIDNKEVEFSNKMENYKKGEQGKLYFVRKDRQKFELQDLLRASAEVLGSGNFGSSYKAMLLNGPALVVKRFRQMSSVGREEFYEYMRRLGRLSHPNLLPLVAFYYKREEKLLITDFAENGSLASHLHGKFGKGGNSDLATWVNSVVREEWTGEVFDKDMKGTKNGEGEMLKLLKIGMYCCEWNVDRRWDLREAVDRIEELKERDSDEDLYSSYASEGEMYSSRAVTDDDFSFSVTG
ncbi:hypothetical protein RJ639_002228 [Escallonia herrerae]|uniref:Protein kinase domain-containing protein n=1 Tax=Escallonia herrerae TaxID=1293975 RepID=A0AA88X7S2_9ASTE|nr:hypothetical protein RJ639_002228 [Escallonia herrerae]